MWIGEEVSQRSISEIRAGDLLVPYGIACLAAEASATLVLTNVSAVSLSVGAAVTVPATMVAEALLSGSAVARNDAFASFSVAAAVVVYAMATDEYRMITTGKPKAGVIAEEAALAVEAAVQEEPEQHDS
mmetsp:Transcript_40550/g.88312  ORF Transcript_40550/g.88312 Transcript_40550/m.88312 type:complete len:130 (-) Transcript_40550:175-564(-)